MHYQRIFLKLSDEALGPDQGAGLTQEKFTHYTREIVQAHQTGIEIAIVLGGGNFGVADNPTHAHYMGMLL